MLTLRMSRCSYFAQKFQSESLRAKLGLRQNAVVDFPSIEWPIQTGLRDHNFTGGRGSRSPSSPTDS